MGPVIDHNANLGTGDLLQAGKTYEVVTAHPSPGEDANLAEIQAVSSGTYTAGNVFTMDSDKDFTIQGGSAFVVREILAKDKTYEIVGLPATADRANIVANSDLTSVDQLVIGNTFTMTGNFDVTGAFQARQIDANNITNRVESVQKKINTSRVQAGSQYAALESAVIYTTDLTAQYELGYNTVHDVNFSMETAHLAKNQILQQAATAMLAQANQGQQGLLQLIQG